jgi:integrase
VTLGRQKVKAGILRFKPKKMEDTSGVDVEVEIPPELSAELGLMPAGDMLFVQTEFGKAYSVKGFGNWFKRQCVLAGLPQCSAHGVRKGGATQRAENGATDYELMALYGWTSPKTSQVYTRKARRKKMAAQALGLLIAPPKAPVGQNL